MTDDEKNAISHRGRAFTALPRRPAHPLTVLTSFVSRR